MNERDRGGFSDSRERNNPYPSRRRDRRSHDRSVPPGVVDSQRGRVFSPRTRRRG